MSKGLEALKRIKKALTYLYVCADVKEKDIKTWEAIDIIENELKRLEELQPFFNLIGQHLTGYNIRGNCEITFFGGNYMKVSEEVFKSFERIWK